LQSDEIDEELFILKKPADTASVLTEPCKCRALASANSALADQPPNGLIAQSLNGLAPLGHRGTLAAGGRLIHNGASRGLTAKM